MSDLLLRTPSHCPSIITFIIDVTSLQQPISGSILRIIITHITTSSFCFICLLIDIIFTLGILRPDLVVFGLPGSFMDPHGLARSSLTGCSSRRGHDRYLTEPLRSTQPGPHFSTLRFHHASPSGRSMFDLILSGYSEEPLLSHSARFIPFDMVVWSCLWCLDFPRHHFRGIRSVTRPIGVILGSSGRIGYIGCHTGHIFVSDEIYGSSRRSSWSCMLIPTYEIHVDTMFPPWSLSGVTQLGLHFATPRCHHAFLPGDAFLIYGSDSVVHVDDLDRAFDDGAFPVLVTLFRASPYFRAITVVLFRLPEPSLSSHLGFQSHHYHLVLASRAITVILFRLPELLLSSWLPEPSLSSCLGFQSHYCRLGRLLEPFLLSRLGFQSHPCRLVLASRAIIAILFRLPEPSLSSRFGFQSHHCFQSHPCRLVLASRAITVVLFRLPELLFSSLAFRSRPCHPESQVLAFVSAGFAHLAFRVLHSSSAFLTSLPGAYRIFISYSRVVRPLLIFDIDLDTFCTPDGSDEFLFYVYTFRGLSFSSIEFTSLHSLLTLAFHFSVHIPYTPLEGSILEGLTAPEKCGGTPLHAWDQLQEIWTAMLMYRDWILADEGSSGAEDGLLRKTQTESSSGRKGTKTEKNRES
ncbi:hypothetical protein CK203_086329 [Vitis vinifera]|uniref:Uncharacterized protein n=1 Tax=Vitis vinifera TaxID=29760 RepID=A0A438DBC8_VITVI|nr:hypothetical protein CK203_086329 [Vitis vinifera]